MAIGDISAVLDTQVITNGRTPRITHISGDYVGIVVWQETTNDGILYTYTIDSAGNIGNTETDSWIFADVGVTPNIVNISDDKYLISYEINSSTASVAATLTISNSGAITKSFIDTMDFSSPPVRAIYNTLLVTGDANDICFSNNYTSKIDSFTADSSGNLGASVADTADYNSVGGSITLHSDIVNIANNYYAVVYKDTIETFSIDSSGNFTSVDSWDYTSDSVLLGNIIKVPDST